MLVTNQTTEDYYFGPLHLAGGVGQQLTIDDTSATSLYLTNDSVADAVNNAYLAGKITVSSQAQPFPRPTGTPQLLHGTGNPEAIVYAAQGSLYIRRDGTGANSVYTKTTGVTLATGWQNYTTAATGPGTTYRKNTPLAVNNTTTETDLLNGQITIGASVMGPTALLRLTAWGDTLQNTGGYLTTMPRFKLKLGATTLIDTGAAVGSPNGWAWGTTRWGWRLITEIFNLSATSQEVHFRLDLMYALGNPLTSLAFVAGVGTYANPGSTLNSAVAEGFNAASVDTTVAEALAFTVINPTASTNMETKLIGALVEII